VRSLSNIINNNGPNTLPWGIPLAILVQSEYDPQTFTCYLIQIKNPQKNNIKIVHNSLASKAHFCGEHNKKPSENQGKLHLMTIPSLKYWFSLLLITLSSWITQECPGWKPSWQIQNRLLCVPWWLFPASYQQSKLSYYCLPTCVHFLFLSNNTR